MINYKDIEEGKTIITGIGMSGFEVTGICTNVMSGLRMVSVRYGDDRLQKEIIEFNNIIRVEE